MRTRWLLLSTLVGLMLMSASCSMFGTSTSQTTTKSLEVSGTALIAAGDIFTHVAAAYTAGCAAKSIAQTQCDAFRAFGLKFKANYPKAASAWQVARSVNDTVSAAQAAATIKALTDELNAYGTAVLTAR